MKKSVLLFMLVACSAVFAQNDTMRDVINVTGEGTVKVTPDEVTVNVSVENEGKDATVVKQKNDRTINEVLTFVKKMNISENDFKTEYVNLDKSYDYNTKTYNYTANQTISIKLKDLKKYEALMDGLLTSGVNRISGVTFSSSNMETFEAEARKKAVMNAKEKANEYATVLGQKIGKAVVISEVGSNSNMPRPMFKAMASAESGSVSKQTLAVGEMEITAKINISFQLY